MTIYSLDVLLFLFGTSLLFHVQFYQLLPDPQRGFSRGKSGGLVFPSLEEFSTFYCDPHKVFGIVNKAEIDVFLELSCFINDPADDGNLISEWSSAPNWSGHPSPCMKGLFPMGCQEKHQEAGLQWHGQSYLQAPAFPVPEPLPDTPAAPTTQALVYNIIAGQNLGFL